MDARAEVGIAKKQRKNCFRRWPRATNLVPSSLPIRLRHGEEDSEGIEFLDLILDIRLDMRILFPYSAKLN